jgi:hypothetical protein
MYDDEMDMTKGTYSLDTFDGSDGLLPTSLSSAYHCHYLCFLLVAVWRFSTGFLFDILSFDVLLCTCSLALF